MTMMRSMCPNIYDDDDDDDMYVSSFFDDDDDDDDDDMFSQAFLTMTMTMMMPLNF